jgi:hypothetical protein
MKIRSQNLRERKGVPFGSMFWHGRAWLYGNPKELLRVEWLFGRNVTDFHAAVTFGYGDSDGGILFHLGIPWLFALYLVIPNVWRIRESKTGIAIHNTSFWIYPFADQNESRHDHPWWKKSYCFEFPWSYKHHLTEILEHKANLPGLAATIWNDKEKAFLDSYDARKAAEKSVSETYDYTYTLKSGEVQHRKATVHVDRMTWRMRGWPLLPFDKVQTCICVSFDGEVGEGTGSYKGGTIGCGWHMLPSETPLETLRRMERDRTFDR